MESSFIKYQVKPKDSLSSIALRMNMSVYDLKEFHNQHCGKMDKLWFENLTGVKFILIPVSYVSQKEKEEQFQEKRPSFQDIHAFHAKEYIVSERFEQPEKADLSLNYTIQFQVKKENEQIIAEITQKGFRRNHEIPDDKVSSLALACMEGISPIRFILTTDGKLQSLYRPEELIQNFKKKKSAMEEFFVGKSAESYIHLFAQNISNENYFFKQLQSLLLYQILFPTMDWFHKKTNWKEKFTIYKSTSPLLFDCKAEYHHEDRQYAETIITGKIDESCSLQELIKKLSLEDKIPEDHITSEIHLHYFTDTTTKQLSEINSSVNIRYRDDLFQNHTLHLKAH